MYFDVSCTNEIYHFLQHGKEEDINSIEGIELNIDGLSEYLKGLEYLPDYMIEIDYKFYHNKKDDVLENEYNDFIDNLETINNPLSKFKNLKEIYIPHTEETENLVNNFEYLIDSGKKYTIIHTSDRYDGGNIRFFDGHNNIYENVSPFSGREIEYDFERLVEHREESKNKIKKLENKIENLEKYKKKIEKYEKIIKLLNPKEYFNVLFEINKS